MSPGVSAASAGTVDIIQAAFAINTGAWAHTATVSIGFRIITKTVVARNTSRADTLQVCAPAAGTVLCGDTRFAIGTGLGAKTTTINVCFVHIDHAILA